MGNRVLRVGGVDEPFNLPWITAFEGNAFASLGLEVTFSTFEGGTGAMVEALEVGEIDIATLVTEGAVTAIVNGSPVRLHSRFTDTPLRWAIHVAARSKLTKLADLEGKKFAVSQFGSGSELMAWVLADRRGWKLKSNQFVKVGGLAGAVEALPKRKAHVFLWERFVTGPLVRQKLFRRIGEIVNEWPAMYNVVAPSLVADPLIDEVIAIVQRTGASLKTNSEATVELIVERYGMTKRDAKTWLGDVEWASDTSVDSDVLSAVMAAMAKVGRIDSPMPVDQLSG